MLKPWLLLPPKFAHDVVPWALPVAAQIFKNEDLQYRPFQWRGLHFKNPIGIAGGVDKTGRNLVHWQQLGVGFLEVGTITPKPQSANPGKIVDRSVALKAVWNKMGFPNEGAQFCRDKLQRAHHDIRVPLFANVGKNRSTDNKDAQHDYNLCIDMLRDNVDGFVINVSSPNTQGLRDLTSKGYLQNFLGSICEYKARTNLKKPLLMKLSPDMNSDELQTALDVSLDLGIDGWILTNTTSSRPAGVHFPVEGGLSGAPLKEKSVDNLKACLQYLGPRKGDRLVISVGGISSAADVRERLQLGADLVQLYSALIFEGPRLFQKIIRGLIS